MSTVENDLNNRMMDLHRRLRERTIDDNTYFLATHLLEIIALLKHMNVSLNVMEDTE